MIQAWPIRRTSEWLGLWTREGSVGVLSGQRGTVQGLWQPCAVAGVLQQHGGGTLAPPAHGSPRLSSFLRLLGPPSCSLPHRETDLASVTYSQELDPWKVKCALTPRSPLVSDIFLLSYWCDLISWTLWIVQWLLFPLRTGCWEALR